MFVCVCVLGHICVCVCVRVCVCVLGRVSSCELITVGSPIEQCSFSVYSCIQHALRRPSEATHFVTKIATTQRGCTKSYQNQW